MPATIADGLGAAEQIALDLTAAFGRQRGKLASRLDALRVYGHAQGPPQPDHGAPDRAAIVVFRHATHEGLVDLDFIEREAA